MDELCAVWEDFKAGETVAYGEFLGNVAAIDPANVPHGHIPVEFRFGDETEIEYIRPQELWRVI